MNKFAEHLPRSRARMRDGSNHHSATRHVWQCAALEHRSEDAQGSRRGEVLCLSELWLEHGQRAGSGMSEVRRIGAPTNRRLWRSRSCRNDRWGCTPVRRGGRRKPRQTNPPGPLRLPRQIPYQPPRERRHQRLCQSLMFQPISCTAITTQTRSMLTSATAASCSDQSQRRRKGDQERYPERSVYGDLDHEPIRECPRELRRHGSVVPAQAGRSSRGSLYR